MIVMGRQRVEVSGVGGIGMSTGVGFSAGVGASSPSVSATSPTTADAIAKSAPPPQSVAEYYAGVQAPSFQEVAGQLKEFSLAELIIALIILAGGTKKNQDKSSGNSALDFLAGLAVGSHFSQPNPQFQPNPPQKISATPSVGGTLDISV